MENYHQKTEYISNSMLNWLNISPKYFYNKINKVEKEEDSDALALGSLVHLAILEPEKFIVSKIDKPTGKLGLFCDAKLQGLGDEESLEFSTYKYKLEKVLEIYNKEGKDYVEERLSNPTALFIDSSTKYKIDKSVDSIYAQKQASKLLADTNCENELEIYWEKDGIKKKGKVDKLILSDLETKNVVYNVDIKTTSSNIYELPIKVGNTFNVEDDFKIARTSYMHSFVKYGYYRQLAMYDEGIKEYIREKYNKEVDVIHLHIVIDTRSFDAMVYKYDDYWLELGEKELQKLIENYKWHKETNYWEAPKQFIDGIVKV